MTGNNPRTSTLRIALLCAALILQVLTFAKHTGVAFPGVPGNHKAGGGSTATPGASPLASRGAAGSSPAAATYSGGSSAFVTGGGTGTGSRLVAAVETSRSGSGPGGALGGSEAESDRVAAAPGGAPLPPASEPFSASPDSAADNDHRSGDNSPPKPPSSGGPGTPSPPHTLDFERVDLMPKDSAGDSEGEQAPASCFTPISDLTTANGSNLDVSVPRFGRVGCDHEWDLHQGPIGKSVTAEADVQLASPSSGGDFNVCALVFYEEGEDWPTQEICQEVSIGRGGGTFHVALSQDAHTARLQQVLFALEAFDTPVSVALTNPHLFVEQAKGSVGPRENHG